MVQYRSTSQQFMLPIQVILFGGRLFPLTDQILPPQSNSLWTNKEASLEF